MRITPIIIGCLLFCALPAVHGADRDQLLDELRTAVRQNGDKIAAINAARAQTLATDPTGLAGSDNFVVITSENRAWANGFLEAAERYRQEIALTWLGKELPAGQEHTIISVQLNKDMDEGLTLMRDSTRKSHRVWLTTSAEAAIGSTLAHEMTHIVLSSRFPKGMPAWANEGIASLVDDQGRSARRKEILAKLRRNNFPAVATILVQQQIAPTDEQAYAVSVSLTEFFLQRGDRATFLRFVEDGSRIGWGPALTQHYSIADVAQLQQQWQNWVTARRL